MNWGDKAEWLIAAHKEANRPIPNIILNKPELPFYLTYAWEAFCLLSSCRQYGFSPQPITLVEIKTYLDMYGKVEDCEAFVEYIKYLDELFLNNLKVQNGRNSSTNKGKNYK